MRTETWAILQKLPNLTSKRLKFQLNYLESMVFSPSSVQYQTFNTGTFFYQNFSPFLLHILKRELIHLLVQNCPYFLSSFSVQFSNGKINAVSLRQKFSPIYISLLFKSENLLAVASASCFHLISVESLLEYFCLRSA